MHNSYLKSWSKKKNITGWPTRKKQKQNLVAGQWRNSIITTWDWNSKRQATVSAHSCLFLCRGAYSGCPKICIYIYFFFSGATEGCGNASCPSYALRISPKKKIQKTQLVVESSHKSLPVTRLQYCFINCQSLSRHSCRIYHGSRCFFFLFFLRLGFYYKLIDSWCMLYLF